MSKVTIDTGTSRAIPTPVPGKRMTVPALRGRKAAKGKSYVTQEPIVMLTAYTIRMAQLLDPHCDMLLVGDSLGQVIYGLPSTIPVTLEMMCAHGAAVVRGSWHALVAVLVWLAGLLLVTGLRENMSANDLLVAIVVTALTWTIFWFARHSRQRQWLR